MKKHIIPLLLALIMVASLVLGAVPALAAEDGITLRLHYHRDDGAYEGWEMWFWDNAGTSKLDPPYPFEEIDGEMVSTINVTPGTLEVGYIVRFGNWDAKDVEEDQYIDVTGILKGTVDVYVKSGVKGHEIKLGDDVETGVVVTAARYNQKSSNGSPQVIVKMSAALDYEATKDTFKVSNSDGAVEITEVKAVNTYYYLTLASELDLTRGYNVTFEENDYAVSMPDFYSSKEFEEKFTYEGDDLGATYTAEKTTLRVWAPTAVQVDVNLYTNGDPEAQPDPTDSVAMTKDVNGTWVATLDGDMKGTYYTYLVTLDTAVNEACDPYARTTGVNGKRAMIVDLDATNPEGWDSDKDPHYDNRFVDAVIYELHVRDLSSDSSSGIKNTGKYLGLTETGTKNSNGISTGLDHIKDLGVTHIHLLPVYDFGSVDETTLNDPNGTYFNWGYDPMNYNVPEGSYSTDPYNGEVRVKEFKQMVKALHDNGLSVIMDVVYNHVYSSKNFCMNMIVPDYFSRPGSNGSGCGNDTASERNMVHKYIVDSVNYWADEYHIDGFRFDLVGLIDTDTINEIVKTVHEKHPNVVFYGEGWTMSTTTTKTGVTLATQTNSSKTPGFAYFSDNIRNTVKGGTYGGVSKGYISGAPANAGELNACFKGMPAWCSNPSQSINYISCHDNNTLFDHIMMVAGDSSTAEQINMNKLGAAFVMTSQGIPFFQAGEEILRSKPNGDGTYNENSYNAADSVNSIKWDDLNKAEYMAVYEYYKGLIEFRKAHASLRLDNQAAVDANVTPITTGLDANVLAYSVKGVEGDKAEEIYVIFNPNKAETNVTLPAGDWHVCVNGEKAGNVSLATATGSVKVSPISAMVLVKGEVEEGGEDVQPSTNVGTDPAPAPANNNLGLIIAISAIVVVAIAVVVAVIIKKKQ